MDALLQVRLWSCEQCCSKDAGATRMQMAQRIAPEPASRRGIFVHSIAASGLHGNLRASAEGDNKDEGRTAKAMGPAASKTRKGRRESDSEPGWEKTAHDLANQRASLRSCVTRPPQKRADGDTPPAPTCCVTCIVTVCAIYIHPDRRASLCVQEAKSSINKFPRQHAGRS